MLRSSQKINPGFFIRRSRLIFALAVLLVLQDVFILRMAGWLLTAGMVFRKPEQGIVFCFFFAPFFWYPAGSFKLFFTLKPFQIAFFLTVLACLFSARKTLWRCIKLSFRGLPNWLLLGFLLSLYLAIFFNHADPKSVRLTLNLTLLIAWFFLAAGMISTPGLFLKCLKSFLAGSALIVAGISLKGALDHAHSIFHGHNAYGNFLLFVIPLVVSFFILKKNRPWKLALWIFFGVLVYNLCMSFSRSALGTFAATFAGMAVFFVLKKHAKAVFLLVVAAGLAFLLAWQSQEKFGDPPMTFRTRTTGCMHMVLETSGIKKKVPVTITGGYQKPDMKNVHGAYAAEGTVDAALKFRNLMRQEAVTSAKKNPWLGKGLYLDGHNLYSDLLYSAGYPGVACLVLFLAFWCYGIIRFIVQNSHSVLIYPVAGILAGVTGWLIQSWVETYLLLFYIWVFLASGAVLMNVTQLQKIK